MDEIYFWIGVAAAGGGAGSLVITLVRWMIGTRTRSKTIDDGLAAAGLLSVGTYFITDAGVYLLLFAGFMVGMVVRSRRAKRQREQEP